MRQFKATQNTPQYGPQSLYVRLVGKFIFMKGVQNSTAYVDKLIENFEKRGAAVVKGNGGWMRIDIIRENKEAKLGDDFIEPDNMTDEQMEDILFNFFTKKYREAKFLVQEVLE